MKPLLPCLLAVAIPIITMAQPATDSFTVHFEFDRYQLTSPEKQKLDEFLRSQPNLLTGGYTALYGHCDSRGTDDYNISLSEKRVQTVRNWLEKKGVKQSGTGKGWGETQPLNKNANDQERRLNRRVVIYFNPEGSADSGNPPTLEEWVKSDSTGKKEQSFILKDINFIGGRHAFLPEAYPRLEELWQVLVKYPKLVIKLEGHICCHGDPGDGYDFDTGINNLSVARAKAVKDYLIEKGIDPARLSYQGFGYSRPLFKPEYSAEQQTANRRVEVRVVKYE